MQSPSLKGARGEQEPDIISLKNHQLSFAEFQHQLSTERRTEFESRRSQLRTTRGSGLCPLQAGEKANDHAKSSGLYLAEAKARVAKRKDMTWPQFLQAHCDIGRSRADELIMIAEGRSEPEASAYRVRGWRAKQAELRRT